MKHKSIQQSMKEPKKSRFFVLLTVLMLLPGMLLFTVIADLPHVFLFGAAGMIASLLISKPIKYSDRSIIYSLVMALVVAVFFDLVFPMDENRSGIISGILQAHVTVPFIIYLVVAVSFYESSAYTLGFSACFSLGVLMICGEMLSGYTGNKRLPGFDSWIFYKKYFYAVSVIIEVFFLMISLNVAWLRRTAEAKFRWQKYTVLILAVIFVVFAAIGIFELFERNRKQFRYYEQYFLRLGMRRPRSVGSIIFDDDIDLHRTINDSIRENSAQIVLRARSNNPPGYLRGRAYTSYNRGRWKDDDPETKPMKFTRGEGLLAYSTFYYTDKTQGPDACYIITSKRFLSDVLLAPGNTGQIDIVAERVKYTPDGTLYADDWEPDGGYTVYSKQSNEMSAFPMPQKQVPESLLRVPDYMKKDLVKELETILESDNQKSRDNDEILIGLLTKYFHRQFSYSLDSNYYAEEEPVLTFLQKTKKGHCELFATAMTLLLRQKGIPARYITGFICEEQHPSCKYYVSRVGNAHAWCEAYLRDQDKWILVEPTPPANIPNFKHEWGMFESWWDYVKQAFQQIIADMRRGYFAKAIISFFVGLFGIIWYTVWDPVRAPIFLLILFFVMRHFRRKWRAADEKLELDYSRVIKTLRSELSRLEKFYSRKTGLTRRGSMTIGEFVNVLPRDENNGIHVQFADLLLQYRNLRYSGREDEHADISPFIEECRNFMKSF